ncbi:hypothetical protein [Jiangella asiatica]|uniref:Arsenate reductase n=1 Tax=Jiangella asiatica TaxID=2530372 RepID=A0A4R5CE00_9ACTN|nr:hypothetical protein [Jiangella asiatica]TDD97126.1 hypothetical protein E1269_29930 [Jiangella asiatica]
MSNEFTDVVPEACTLPTAQRPLRVAEFRDLFAAHLRAATRTSPTTLRLELDGDPATAATTRDLTDRETTCCSFFTFTTTASAGALAVDVAVPAVHAEVLTGLHRLATGAAT